MSVGARLVTIAALLTIAGRMLARLITGAKLILYPDAGHASYSRTLRGS